MTSAFIVSVGLKTIKSTPFAEHFFASAVDVACLFQAEGHDPLMRLFASDRRGDDVGDGFEFQRQ